MSQINKRTRRRRRHRRHCCLPQGRAAAIQMYLKDTTKPKITHCFVRFASTYLGSVCRSNMFCLRITFAIDYVRAIRETTYRHIWMPSIVLRYCISKLSSAQLCLCVCVSVCLCAWNALKVLVLLSCFHSSLCEFNTFLAHVLHTFEGLNTDGICCHKGFASNGNISYIKTKNKTTIKRQGRIYSARHFKIN